jgi:hypothetical protein
MALSTTQSIWRSGGGDNTRTAYCGTGVMVAEFYFLATQASGNAKVSSAANAANVILPANAVILQINVNAAGTGGTTPTFDMGFTLYTTGTASPQALLNESDADVGKQVLDWASATAGTSLNAVMSATELVYITGRAGASAATGGNISGEIIYYVTDPLLGQQND